MVDIEIAASAGALPELDGGSSSREGFDATDLLDAKLAQPRLPAGFVIRPRILQLLADAASKALTVVSAGPGWGKTLAVAAWATSRGSPYHVAWVSLDEGDNGPRGFWSYVIAALRRTGGVPADSRLTELAPGAAFDSGTMRRIINGVSRLPGPIVLVLDDFHEITDPAVLSDIDTLLRHPLPQLRLVLVTRVDPTLSLHRLRLNEDLAEIRAADLAFNEEEAAAFFAQHNVNVGTSLGRLLSWTEGWAAGLRLAALALQGDSSASRLEQLTEDDRIAADYLAGEVLAAQSPALREFLLHTCIAERLTADLADALTGRRQGQQHLAELEHANAFVVGLGSTRRWYRYHPMLRGMLQHQLSMQQPDVVPTLHRRAALWLANHGQTVEAMRHAALASDWSLLGRLLVTRGGPRVVSVEREALVSILEQLPVADGDDGALLALCRAAKCVINGRFAAMRPHLEQAWQSLPDVEADIRPAAQAVLHLFFAVLARLAGDVQTSIAHNAKALDLLRGEAGTVPAADEYVAIALNNYGMGLLWSGDYKAAEQSLTEALNLLESQDIEITKINALGQLGVAAASTGRLRQANEYGTAAVDLANLRGWNTLEQVSSAYLALALVNFHQNALEAADRLSQHGLAAQATGADRMPFTALQVLRTHIHTARGQLALANEELDELRRGTATWPLPELVARWLNIAEAELDMARGDGTHAAQRLNVHGDFRPTSDQEAVCLARALLQQGEPDRAEQVVAPLRELARDRGAEIQAWLVTALTADYKREDHRATSAVERAIVLAKDEGFRRPFTLFDGERLPRLVSHVIRLVPAYAEAAHDLFDGHVDGGRSAAGAPTEQLTDRELTVLEYLPTMLSNAEIAAEMYVSVNTIKAHLKTLYRKLAVSNRRDAVHRARTLNLFSKRPE